MDWYVHISIGIMPDTVMPGIIISDCGHNNYYAFTEIDIYMPIYIWWYINIAMNLKFFGHNAQANFMGHNAGHYAYRYMIQGKNYENSIKLK